MANQIRVRIAPSPTGPLHIGTARTALFNFLFARQQKGVFVLRFEDTDTERSKDLYVDSINSGLEWLGLAPADEVYFQSKRQDIYKTYLDKLAQAGLTYEQDGGIFFKLPTEDREVVVHDLIRGDVKFRSKDFDDIVLIKKDGMPTFHFANVVDDIDMKISHVIRGEDHLSNTPGHILLFEALGAPVPIYAHLPLILNPDRTKMSKRSGDTSLKEYIDKGYLREAMINFMVQLGWSDPDGQEVFSFDELVTKFDLSRVQKGGAIFNIKHLNHINHQYLMQKSLDEYIELARPFISGILEGVSNHTAKRILAVSYDETSGRGFFEPDNVLRKALALVQDRAQTLSEIPTLIDYFFQLPDYSAEMLVFKKSSPEQTAKGLDVALAVLTAYFGAWEEPRLKQVLDEALSAEGLMPGDIFWPIRVALSGNEASPSPTELLDALGKNESLERIKLAIGKLAG